MKPDRLPFVRYVLESGPDDPVFDGLLLGGPVVIGVIALLPESPVSVALASLYLLVFVGYLPYKWFDNREATG